MGTTWLSLADLSASVGQAFGPSDWLRIDQQTISEFARVTRDEQWIHMDAKRAAAGPFGVTIVHGFLTLAVCPYLLDQCVQIKDCEMAINYGLNRVRFPSPLPAGGEICGHAVVVAADYSSEACQAVYRMTVEVNGSAKPGCVADLVIRYLPRADRASDEHGWI
jgi:acyl dehydratase